MRIGDRIGVRLSIGAGCLLLAAAAGGCGGGSGRPDGDAETDGDTGSEPVYWSETATVTREDRPFVPVDGMPFFALGLHANAGLTYDGVSGEGVCDRESGAGYLDINIDKHHAAHAAGANFIYLWGYGERIEQILDVTPRWKGIFHRGYGLDRPEADDVVPIVFNEFGETDLEGYAEQKAVEMETAFAEFIERTGAYSPASMPNLPPLSQVGHLAWHPTFRMIGNGEGEQLEGWQADRYSRATNMMIGDTYTYVENRFDLSDPLEAILAAGYGQKGDKGEGYDQWLAADDPDHRSMFTSGFELTESIVRRANPGTVVWMWLQGYSFGNGIRHSACRGQSDDAWAQGGFPPLAYLKKEAMGMIAAGATGFIFFGYPDALPGQAEVVHTFLRALSAPGVYGPALLSPRLELGYDTLFIGEAGYDGRGRAHLRVAWDAASRTAYVLGANPGARATAVDLPFPWSLATAELLDWEAQTFTISDRLAIDDRTLRFAFAPDEGVVIRVRPLFGPETARISNPEK